MIKLAVIKDCGDCRGCGLLANLLMQRQTFLMSDEQFNQERARNYCGSCKRKPVEVVKYNSLSGHTHEIKLVEGTLTRVSLKEPAPLKDLWTAVDSGARDLILYPKGYSDKLSPEAALRITHFLENRVYEEKTS